MKLYKYRSFEKIEHTLDILINERLHCAPYDELNDPFEGIFLSVMHIGGFFLGVSHLGVDYCGDRTTVKERRSISDLPTPGSTRVCSLTASGTDVRLWSHYAEGHTGIAIEIDIDESDSQLHKVEYVEQLKEFGHTVQTGPESTEVLRIKSYHWDYEKEYRIISREEYYSVSGKITGVYLGLRTSLLMQEVILRSLKNVIPIYTTKLNEKTIEIELNKQINGDSNNMTI
jgi:hypothetical protein